MVGLCVGLVEIRFSTVSILIPLALELTYMYSVLYESFSNLLFVA